MDKAAILIRGARIIDPSQSLDRAGDILVQGGAIKALDLPGRIPSPEGCVVVEAEGLVACPGFIDIHCHLREPGYEDKETIATGTLAAARGGFTTLCCMPNTHPPIDSAAVVDFVLRKAREEGAVRVYPIGCVSKGREGKELSEMAELVSAGVVAFSDDGSPVADASLMRLALTYGLRFGLPIIDHCEEPSLTRGGVMNEGWVATRLGLRGIPPAAEEAMAARDIALAELTGGRLHLAHITTARTLELVRRAKERGLPITAEVTPHHLTLTDEWASGYRGEGSPLEPLTPGAYDTFTKVYPPLRSRRDVEALVEGLREGVIDAIATDHAPHEFTTKTVTYEEASFGISVLETALGSLMLLVERGALDLMTLVHRLTVGPARVVGGPLLQLATLKPGHPADITLFDPRREWVVDTREFASKGRNTPLEGVTLRGRVMATIVEGRFAYIDPGLKRDG